MTREEHLKWCKARALAYLPDHPTDAFTSMASDLGKHPETAGHSGIELGMMLLIAGHLKTEPETRRFIEGFN